MPTVSVSIPVLLAFAFAAGAAQTAKVPVPPPPSGTVTGRVVFAETRLPARFAEVDLLRKPTAEELIRSTQPAANRTPTATQTNVITGHSSLDGSYSIADVPPGDYYVFAKLAGYVLPLPAAPKTGVASSAPAAQNDLPTVMNNLMANFPVVHVAADRSVSADLVLRHGAGLSGRVRYEDGSSAAGVYIQPQSVDGRDDQAIYRYGPFLQALSPALISTMANDEGRFRVAGLQPGKYILRVNITVEGGSRLVTDGKTGSTSPSYAQNAGARAALQIFAPGVFHKDKARVFEISGDEQVMDVDIDVVLSGLHSLRGHVFAKEDRHTPNQGGVGLTDENDKTFNRYAPFDADGAFHLDYLPAGTYTLTVNSAADLANPNEISPLTRPETTTRYAPAKMQVIVGEHDAILDDILLVPVAPRKSPTQP